MADEYAFREYSRGFTIVKSDAPKTYGPVRRGDRITWRNYRRPIKHPKARSCVDMMKALGEEARRGLERYASEVFRG